MMDQAASLRRLMMEKEQINKSKPKVITITSGKGGVGKSNFIVNLGITLQKQGKRVLILDADIGMGNDDVLMGVFPRFNIFDVIHNGREINEIIVSGYEGISLLSGGSGLNKIEDLSEDERKIFLQKIEAIEDYDFILIDTGAGINKSVLAFIYCSDEVILITTPEPTSLTDGYALLKAVKYFDIDVKINVVVNKIYSKKEGILTYTKFKSAVDKFLKIDIDYLGSIMEDRKLVLAVKEQIPFVIKYKNCEATKGINEIASKIIKNFFSKEGTSPKNFFKNIFSIFT